MNFFQSREIKIFLTAFVSMVALTLGAMKMAGSHPNAVQNQPIQNSPNGVEEQILQEPEQPMGEQTQNIQSEDNPAITSDAFRSGQKAQKEGDTRSALKYYNIASNNSDVKIKSAALGELANIYMQYNDSKMVIETLGKQLEIEQDSEIRKKAFVNLAETYKYLDTYDKAIEMYQESYKLEKTPNDVIQICEMYEKLHDEDGIRDQINDYLKDYPYQVSLFSKYRPYLNQPPRETKPADALEEYNPPGMNLEETEQTN